MQKRSTPNPYLQKKEIIASRCTSSMGLDQEYPKYHRQQVSTLEIEPFCVHFSKIIRNFLPGFKLPYSIDQLSGILELLPSTLQEISEAVSNQATEHYKNKESSFNRTSKNLMKYEELLKEKAKELEEEIQHWEQTKFKELHSIENQKNDLMKAKVQLEQEISIAAEAMKEKENRINLKLQEVEVVAAEMHRDQLKNKEMEWKMQKFMRDIEEKEAILNVREQLIQKDKEEMLQERSNYDNEKMVNQVLNLELLRESNKSRSEQRCSSTLLVQESNRSYISEVSNLRPSSRLDSKSSEPNMCLTKQAYFDIINTKASLENSAAELEEIQSTILPDIQKQSEDMVDLHNQLQVLKESTEDYLNEVIGKFELFEKKYEELEVLIKENEEKRQELEAKREDIELVKKELDGKIKLVEVEKDKLQEEIDEFQLEKIEYYEDVSKERERIQEYYIGIEEKVQLLDTKRIELENAKMQFQEKELKFNSRSDHVLNSGTD